MTNSTARTAVLEAIRAGLGSAGSEPTCNEVVSTAQQPGQTGEYSSLLDLFCARAAEENATSERIPSASQINAAIVRYLNEQQLVPTVLMTGNVGTETMAGAGQAGLEVPARDIRPDGDVVVTGCLAGIADSGAVVTTSGPDCPNEWQYLAETHIVIVPAECIVEDHDKFWTFLSTVHLSGLPRALNWIVGPSRTADLGVPSRLGAHGPARVHLLVVG